MSKYKNLIFAIIWFIVLCFSVAPMSESTGDGNFFPWIAYFIMNIIVIIHYLEKQFDL